MLFFVVDNYVRRWGWPGRLASNCRWSGGVSGRFCCGNCGNCGSWTSLNIVGDLVVVGSDGSNGWRRWDGSNGWRRKDNVTTGSAKTLPVFTIFLCC